MQLGSRRRLADEEATSVADIDGVQAGQTNLIVGSHLS